MLINVVMVPPPVGSNRQLEAAEARKERQDREVAEVSGS